MQALAQMAISAHDRYSLGLTTPPGTQAAINAALRPGSQPATTSTGSGGAGGDGAAVPNAGGATIGQRQNNPGNLTFAGQPYASPGQGNRFASFPDMATGVAANADQLSLYQTQHGINTVRGAVTRWVGDPKADLTSYIGDIAKSLGVGPDDKIDLTDPAVQAKFIQAQFPHESAGGGYVLNPADVAKGVQMAAARRGQQVQPAPPGGGVVARNPGAVQVAGPGAGPPTATSAAPPDLTGPRPLPPTGPGAPVVTPQQLANTPTNQVMPGAPNGPPAAAPPAAAPAAPGGATTAQQQQPPPATRANLPHAADVPTGVNSPQYQQAADLQRRALTLEAQVDPTGRLKQLAAGLRQQAQLLLQTDSVVQTQEGQLHPLTGQISDPTKPLPNYVYDARQHAYIDTTGTNKPEFEPAQRDSAVAQRDVMELGPKVANGTATQQEQARYATAVETYRQPTLRENPVTKETLRVNTRELPAGFPEPPSLGSGAPGTAGGGGGSQVVIPGYSPAQQQVERDPAAYKVAETRYVADAEDARQLGPAGRKAQADQVRIKEMEDVLQRFSTGQGTEARTAAAAFLQRWLPSAITGWEKESANLSGAEAAQAFGKLALVGAGSQEQSVLGPRGGYQAIKLFKDANPGINLQDATNKSILDMQLISNQANYDYSQAALSHFTENENKFKTTHQYDSLNQFDRNWNDQRNPEVYAAAMGAISGQQPEKWAKGLSDAEYDRALQIVSRAKPDAVVNTKSGRYSMQPTAVTSGTQAKSGDTVIRFDHSGNRLP
jgi:hypothetical protein